MILKTARHSNIASTREIMAQTLTSLLQKSAVMVNGVAENHAHELRRALASAQPLAALNIWV